MFLKRQGNYIAACPEKQSFHLRGEGEMGVSAPLSGFSGSAPAKPYITLWENTPKIWEHSRNIENTRLRLVFSAFPLCSQIPVVFYHSVIRGLGFFIC